VLPLRGEKPQNRPLSKLNTGRFALRAMLPVTIGAQAWGKTAGIASLFLTSSETVIMTNKTRSLITLKLSTGTYLDCRNFFSHHYLDIFLYFLDYFGTIYRLYAWFHQQKILPHKLTKKHLNFLGHRQAMT